MKLKMLFSAALIAALATACSEPDPLHHAMEGMGGAFKELRKAESIEDKKMLLAELEKHINVAAQQKVAPEDQENFDKGMEKLKVAITAIKLQLSQGNVDNIKPQLKELGQIRKEYHELLGVSKD
ncbi:cytochrome b562 [Gayadomonas joobiniege]|uniref:cytochrome b562 n=1 Tax=Gayadomonas joobiniege TaxID=1234606 RepID=UPI00036B0B30|nr:cytochrome b562 [Gayadomonas joobiniege]